jgi:signal transduction histidine kinase
LADAQSIRDAWIGRLVRVLLVFRALVLLITVLLLHERQRTFVVGIAVILAAAISYVPLRRWNRIASSISRHPLYLALEVLLATLILAAAGARSPFFFFTLGTAALAGVIYGRRGAIPFSALLMAAYELVALEGFPTLHRLHDVQSVVLAPLLYPVAVVAGIAARELVERGVETEGLLRERTEALAAERERLRVARELHDSLAKTVEGLAMTASVLPRRCERDPKVAAALARELAADAQQAAREARALMTDLRESESKLPLVEAIRRRAQVLGERFGLAVHVGSPPDATTRLWNAVPGPAQHELVRILGEALVNAARHGAATNVVVSLEADEPDLVLSVSDDGRGLTEPVDVEQLKAAGHFGLAGMHERARAIGATLLVQAGLRGGTTVSVRLPALGEDPDDAVWPAPLRPARVRVLRPTFGRRQGSARMRA